MKAKLIFHEGDRTPSPNQYRMLLDIAEYVSHNGPIPPEGGTRFTTNTLNSAIRWRWVEFVDRPRKGELGWVINKRGYAAIEKHENAKYERKNDKHVYSPVIQQVHAALTWKYEVEEEETRRPVNIQHHRNRKRAAA